MVLRMAALIELSWTKGELVDLGGDHLEWKSSAKSLPMGSQGGTENLRFFDGAVEEKRSDTGQWSAVAWVKLVMWLGLVCRLEDK